MALCGFGGCLRPDAPSLPLSRKREGGQGVVFFCGRKGSG
ncbi:hypothetical protein HMPREF9080_02808 [Cardiobacterium valvarum F0432]|uniref:Uncharacterized protein n=1 Tax=Cardiobacterium valvarum F0432 TaxID=797473 RepID=G9ZJ39_9GAMM|nr:hypothetical protein HMPREF9080_02808 [Cardiobacterium valvarum F0432]